MTEEIEKLKEENKELKKECNAVYDAFDYRIQYISNGNKCKEDEKNIEIIKQKLKELKANKKLYY